MSTRAGIAYIDVRLGDFTKFAGQLKAKVTAAGDSSAREFGQSFSSKLATDKGQFDGLTAGLRSAVQASGVPIAQLQTKLKEAGKGGADGFLREFSPLLRKGISASSIDAKDRLLEAFDTKTISPRLASTLRASLTEALTGSVVPAVRTTEAATTSAFANMGAAARSFGTRIGLLGFQIANLGYLMTFAITGPIVALGTLGTYAGLKLASSLETAQFAFEAMLGSAQAAKDFLKDLRKFATASPLFDTDSVIAFARSLLAAGVPASDMQKTLTALSSITAYYGVTTADTSSVVRALGQVLRKGKIYQEELNQFTEAGIDIQGILAKSLGKTKQQIEEMVKAGTISAPQLLEAMQKIGNSKDYLLALEGQAKSLSGVWQQFKETLTSRLADAVTPQLGKIKDILGEVGTSLASIITNSGPFFVNVIVAVDKLAKGLAYVSKAFAGLTPAQQAFVTKLILLLALVGPLVIVFGSFVTGLGAIASAVGAALNPVGGIVALIAALGLALFVAYKRSKPYRDLLLDVWSVLVAIGRIIGGVIKGIGDALRDAAGKVNLTELFKQAVQWGHNVTSVLRTEVLPTIRSVAEHFLNILKPAIKAVGDIIANWVIPTFTQFTQFLNDHKETVRQVVAVAGFLLKVLGAIALVIIGAVVVGFVILAAVIAGVIYVATFMIEYWIGMVEALKSLWHWLGNVDDFFIHLWGTITGFFRGLANEATRHVTETRDFLVNKVPAMFASVGESIVNGIVAGIRNVGGRVASAAVNVVKDAYHAASHFLIVGSPSRLTMQLGTSFGQGLAVGIDQTQPLVARSSVALATAGVDALSVGRGGGGVEPQSGLIIVKIGEKQVTDIVVDAARRRAADLSGIVDLGATKRQRRG